MILGLAAALALQSAPAEANTIARLDPIVPGMPAAEAAALLPAGPGIRHREGAIEIDDLAVAEGCEADAEVKLAGGAVGSVELRGDGALLGRCGRAVLDALVARFGRPDKERSRGETPWRRSRSTFEWSGDGRTVRYVLYTSAGYAGAGLFEPSWVMTIGSARGGAGGSD